MLITIHMNEVAFDSEESVRRYGMRSIPFLASIGFLRDDVLHAHGVWNDDEDIRLLAKHRCAVSYNLALEHVPRERRPADRQDARGRGPVVAGDGRRGRAITART